MAAEWYYTTNKQQMGPVTWDELRELAEAGILKAHDMVWAEGMDEWVKAINQKGLFGDDDDGIEEASTTAKKKKAKPPPGRRKRVEEEDEDDEEDERESKRKARKAEQERAKMGVWIKVGLIVGGILFALLLCGGCGIGIFVFAFRDGGGGGPRPNVRDNYTINNLRPGGQNNRNFNFTQGRRVIITVTNTLANPNTDVDLHVFRGNAGNPFIVDVRIPAQDRNCRVEFVVPANDSYKVQVVNLGPGTAISCAVSVVEQ